MDDPFEVAVEHVAWCLREGMSFAAIYRSIGEHPPKNKGGWMHLIWRLATLYESLSAENIRLAA